MAYDEGLRSITLLADSSIGVYTGVPDMPGSASPNSGPAQYRFVKVTDVQTAGVCTAATDIHVGICQNKPQAVGDPATVAIGGVSRIIAGTGGFAAGNLLASDSAGGAVVDATHGKWQAVTTVSAGQIGSAVRVL